MRREKRNEVVCEEERKIESSSEEDRDRDRLSKGVECESEKNAKMHVTGVERVAIRRGPNELRGVGCVPRRKEKSRKRDSEARRERRARRHEDEKRDESDERGKRLREYRANATWGSEKERRDEKERRCTGKRGGTRYRVEMCEREIKRGRKQNGKGESMRVKREDEKESARQRVRQRERDGRICVLKQTFDQSADCCQSYVAAAYPSVPVAGPRIQFRVFTRRGNQGSSARAAIRENRSSKCVASRGRRPCVLSFELSPHLGVTSLKGRGRVTMGRARLRCVYRGLFGIA